MAKCIITGCDLVDIQQGRWCHGDLWQVENSFVFNACLVQGEVAWEHLSYDNCSVDSRRITVHPSLTPNYFERRGVIVVGGKDATLSPQALEYIRGS